jgi:hypothetical protein
MSFQSQRTSSYPCIQWQRKACRIRGKHDGQGDTVMHTSFCWETQQMPLYITQHPETDITVSPVMMSDKTHLDLCWPISRTICSVHSNIRWRRRGKTPTYIHCCLNLKMFKNVRQYVKLCLLKQYSKNNVSVWCLDCKLKNYNIHTTYIWKKWSTCTPLRKKF